MLDTVVSRIASVLQLDKHKISYVSCVQNNTFASLLLKRIKIYNCLIKNKGLQLS